MKKQRFSLRRLAVGVVSIGLGTAMVPAVTQLGSVEIVKADTDTESTNDEAARQVAIQEVEAKRDEVVAAILKLKNNDLSEDQVKEILSSEIYQLDSLDTYASQEKDELVRKLSTVQFKYDLIDEVLTQWNAFYVSKGIEHKLGFSDLERVKKYDDSSPKSSIRYGYPTVSNVIEPTDSVSSSFRLLSTFNLYGNYDENDMVRDQRYALKDVVTFTENYTTLKEAREKYNAVVTYFNAQPEETRKEQFTDFADESFRSIWHDIQGTGAYLNREDIVRKLTLLENRIKGKIADEKAITQAVKEVNDKKSTIVAAIQKLENIQIEGDISDLYVNENGHTSYNDFTVDELSRLFLTFEELETAKQTKFQQWEHLLEQMNVINDILIQANQFEDKQGGEKHRYTTSRNYVESKEETRPTIIASQPTDEFLADKVEVTSVSLTYEFEYSLDEISRTGDSHVIEEKRNVALSLLSLAKKKYDAMTEVVSAYNQLIDKINALPQEKRRQTWLDLIYQKDPYLYVLDELRFGDGVTEEETESRKENLLSIFKKFDQETFASTAPSTESSTSSSENTTNQSSDSTVSSSGDDSDKKPTMTSSNSTNTATSNQSSQAENTSSSNQGMIGNKGVLGSKNDSTTNKTDVTISSNMLSPLGSGGQVLDLSRVIKELGGDGAENAADEALNDSELVGLSHLSSRETTSLTVRPRQLPKTGTNWSILSLVSFLPMLVGAVLFKKKS
ncbi:YSIRK-type signal peptide-containing protein [Streptococcus sp. zg-86]|uniref:YSIRK-type signal peptide-containing protein n=1 Tax=Streptococcus zhangguiae TaxID=2664091 RepID=A0A6I4RI65_9STRE|nr:MULTISPECIES: YSIRK-type signal peptide-containing protein [unclassified Streptococcus]MTB65097.1 YSIRK-type signal peptide-containing protein [Streptococcus sp. zg-86]MTB91357.1 YSIRK-type signal peptide-containing protein [Streptococcus sp. zg-36]MWV57084.1 YSIRK-type signal peptide-containing protein [Streptococcus sp. zg-70]QTH47826.1 YSIRK-type signal peptide-containing protein [Streptococcus sp. zg-86]